jgi:cell division protease FtsH
MPIKDKPTLPRFRLFNNIFLILGVLFLIASFILPTILGPQIPGVPYSLFIHQVQEGEVARVQVGQNQIQYQLKSLGDEAGPVFSTTPIFDLSLPGLLEDQGVEFAAAPPPKNRWIGSVLSWVIPPLIFVGLWQFFIRRNSGGGGPQGMLSIGKSKAKVYVEGEPPRPPLPMWPGWKKPRPSWWRLSIFSKTQAATPRLGRAFPRGCCWWGHRAPAKPCWPRPSRGRPGCLLQHFWF